LIAHVMERGEIDLKKIAQVSSAPREKQQQKGRKKRRGENARFSYAPGVQERGTQKVNQHKEKKTGVCII